MFSFDASELVSFIRNLTATERAIGAAVTPVVKRGAQNIKADAARRAGGIRHAPYYPRSITYDFYARIGGAEAVIGPDKDRRQGALGNILEFGTSKNAPLPHLRPALEAEEPGLLAALEAAQADVLGEL